MNDIFKIPDPIKDEAKSYFGPLLYTDAVKFIKLSKVSVSFSKQSSSAYFIASGIVRADRIHECKIVYKDRLKDTEEGPLSSNCDCHLWSKKDHCPHTAALFLAFKLQSMNSEQQGLEENYPPIPINTTFGVTVENYGEIISGPQSLVGAPPRSTYSSLQYLLHNRKVVNFNIPKSLNGKIIISVRSSEFFNEELGKTEYRPRIQFFYQDENGKKLQRVSLFESLYLFNWDNGEVYHLPSEIKYLISAIRIKKDYISINGLLRIFLTLENKDHLSLEIDDTPLEEIEKLDLLSRIDITPSAKKNLIKFSIFFFDKNESLVSSPEFLKAFTFEGGSLNSFRRKKDSYEFITALTKALSEGPINSYKTSSISSSRKDYFSLLVEYITETEKSFYYDPDKKVIHSCSNKDLIDLFVALKNSFGESFFRYSKYNEEENELSYDLTSTTLFSGLSDFHKKVLHLGIQIFYSRNEISYWGPKMRFERRESTTKWFDLQLEVEEDDLQIIKNADQDTGLSLTQKGLVLLSNEQKSLLKFMKKYVQYEGESENSEESQEGQNIKKFSLPFNKTRIFELFELKKLGIEGALTKDEEEFCHKLATLEKIPDYPLPKHLESTLRPYQKTGHNWLRFLHEHKLGACLADDMGLGKTLQTITFIQGVYDQIDHILIVCPVSILLNWEKEFQKFSDLDVSIYHGPIRELKKDSKIILTSYGVMKKEAASTFSSFHFDVLILDEVQHLKNIRSLGALAARELKAEFRICLTGTPVENDLAEFYNILDLSIPGIWGDLQFFRTSSNKKSRLIAKKTARPFILRRTKKEVLSDLPEKIENNIFLSFDEEEKKKYEQSLLRIRNEIKNSMSRKKYGIILKGLLELRQLCLWQGSPNIASINSTKIRFLIESLEQIIEEGHQAIIFSQFTTYLDIINTYLKEKHWKISRIDGTQSIKRRQQEVDTFQSGNSQVFLISLKAGGVGLNLTAASYVFIMDPWWNPAVENQAIDRAHRIGQKSNLTVFRPLIQGSVEEKVLELQKMKKELFSDLLHSDEEEIFSGKLTMKDFEHLFE